MGKAALPSCRRHKKIFPRPGILFICLLFCGCARPTYPAGQLTTAVQKICKNEYKLDIKTRLIEKTLGISFSIDGLINEELELSSQGAEKIEDAALALQRVSLSTDYPVQFYVLCARDSKLTGAEYLLIGNITDVKRISVQDISRSEYLQRLQRSFHIEPVTLGKNTVGKMFAGLNNNIPPETALKTYAHFPITSDIVEEIFYPGRAVAQPGSIIYQVIETHSKKLSDSQALFWVKTKETYQENPAAKRETALFPRGFENAYLILIDRSHYEQPIADIICKFFRQENRIMRRDIPQIFAGYPETDTTQFDQDGLPLKEINLNEFLAAQIARRLKETLEKENLPVSSISARFEENLFRLRLDTQGEEQQTFREALKMVGNITYGYRLKDFNGAEIISQTTGKKVSASRQELEKLRKDKGKRL